MLPDTDESPLFGSGFSFLKAPSAGTMDETRKFDISTRVLMGQQRRQETSSPNVKVEEMTREGYLSSESGRGVVKGDGAAGGSSQVHFQFVVPAGCSNCRGDDG